MKAKRAVKKKKGIASRDVDHDRHDSARIPDLKITERKEALNKIIDAIESKKIVSSSEIRMLRSDKLTTMVRVDRFIGKMCRLIVRATEKDYYKDDNTQPNVEDFAYEAIQELAWRTAENVGFEKTKELVDAALESVEMEFGDIQVA